MLTVKNPVLSCLQSFMIFNKPPSRTRPIFRPPAALLLSAGALLLGGCASYDAISPREQAIAQVQFKLPEANTQDRNNAWPEEAWWQRFGDAQLNALMQSALAKSPSLAVARARLAKAQASVDLTASVTAPQIGVGANAGYGRLSANGIIPPPPFGPGGTYVTQDEAAVNFSYDLDLWGRTDALIHSAQAQENAATYDQAAARLALTTALARAYVQLAAQYDLQKILEATQRQRIDISRLTALRVRNGLETQVESKQAEGNAAAIDIDLAQLATSIQVTRLQLAQLSGQLPDAAATIRPPTLKANAFDIPDDLPIGLLARRPELAAERARIEAAVGATAAARAAFYPSINLSALIGFQSIGLGKLFAADSLTNSVGPAITLPLFDGGRLRANYRAKAADIDAAIAQYNDGVLHATQDVAEQLTRISALRDEERAVARALDASEEALRLATLRYKAGLSTNLTVLTVQTQVLAQRRAAANVAARRQTLQVDLIRALGGGFHLPSRTKDNDVFAGRTNNN